eukprot:scaffold314365_cov26-Prasinocladus_malaysianus.AAC.1
MGTVGKSRKFCNDVAHAKRLTKTIHFTPQMPIERGLARAATCLTLIRVTRPRRGLVDDLIGSCGLLLHGGNISPEACKLGTARSA